jgi:hypothetical protein
LRELVIRLKTTKLLGYSDTASVKTWWHPNARPIVASNVYKIGSIF